MSSYNENLRSNVVASLQTQELDLTKVKSQKNASMFTLYYNEGATLKAGEQLEYTAGVLVNKAEVKTQAVANSNISNNLLGSANQANLYVKQSITNSAVSAANVQLASNAIVRLASDLGSIYSIVHAADAKSDIYILAEEARSLINTTAYDAEVASQIAMEASILTSEVSASTVLDKSKANNDLMNTVLKITTDEVTATSQLVLAENGTLAAASAVEKQSEGDYLDISIDYQSTKAAYQATNKGLNLNLLVSNQTAVDFTVSFDRIKMPFKHLETISPAVKKANPYYPIKNYYLIVVKDAKKSTFSISNAENLLIGDEGDPTQASSDNSAGTSPVTPAPNPKRLIIPVPVPVETSDPSSSAPPSTKGVKPLISCDVNYQEMIIDGKGPFTIQDSDGDDIVLGTRYVVFVLGLYTDDYKKKLNCFDDFLSAPSPSFILTTKLVAVDGKTIKLPGSTSTPPPPSSYEQALQAPPSTISNDANILLENGVLNFKVAENPDNVSLVEYRCIFLPPNDPWAGLLLNKESTLALKQEVESLEAIAEEYDPQIAIAQANVIDTQNYIDVLGGKLTAANNAINTQNGDKEQVSAAVTALNLEVSRLNTQIEFQKNSVLQPIQKSLEQLIKEKNDKIDSIKKITINENVQFLFNLKIAEQVLFGNYIVANKSPFQYIQPPAANSVHKKTKGSGSGAITGDTSHDGLPYPEVDYIVQLNAAVTDNFGNPLIEGQKYTPVIVSYCTAAEENISKFTNSWSGYHNSTPIVFKNSSVKS